MPKKKKKSNNTKEFLKEAGYDEYGKKYDMSGREAFVKGAKNEKEHKKRVKAFKKEMKKREKIKTTTTAVDRRKK